jgi:hypothetical protein
LLLDLQIAAKLLQRRSTLDRHALDLIEPLLGLAPGRHDVALEDLQETGIVRFRRGGIVLGERIFHEARSLVDFVPVGAGTRVAAAQVGKRMPAQIRRTDHQADVKEEEQKQADQHHHGAEAVAGRWRGEIARDVGGGRRIDVHDIRHCGSPGR